VAVDPEVGAGSPSARPDIAPEVTIRPARPGDTVSFLSMWTAVVAEQRFVRTERVTRSARYYRRHYFRRSWTDEEAAVVAVLPDDGERVIGHLHASREENPVNRHVASLGMAVARQWRGRGVGSALLVEAIRWASEMGVEKLALSVYPDNAAARALYRKFGFREEGRLTGQSRKSIGYRDEIHMGLWLIAEPDGSGGAG
jgi:ribosomal protein S18 acetylase RimI-like enzyme